MTKTFRSTTSLTLIGVLLICPFLCLGESEAASSEGTIAGCTCHDSHSQGEEKTPESPQKSDHDCLCEGAITDAVRIDQQQFDADDLVVPLVEIQVRATLPLADSHAVLQPACQFASLMSGREICALVSARLL